MVDHENSYYKGVVQEKKMAKARRNLLAGRLAEHLVCAELSRLGLIATTFTHNVPVYDVLATNEECRTVPIQVKATRDKYWRTSATDWMNINRIKEEQIQKFEGRKELSPLNPVWVCVAIGEHRVDDLFFIMTQYKLQEILIKNYTQELDRLGGKRPKNWEAVDCWWSTEDVGIYRDNWQTIVDRLTETAPDAS